jgi:hypothetical protein
VSKPAEAQMHALMLDTTIRSATSEWIFGDALEGIPAMMFAVRAADIYAFVLQRAGNDRIELAAMTRDGNVIPLVQDVKFSDEEVKK